MVANILKPVLIGVALLAFVWAFFALFYQPGIQRIDSLNREIVSMQERVGEGKAVLNERDRFLRDESSAAAETAFLEKKFPVESLIPEVIHELSANAPSCGVNIQSIEPGAGVKRTFSEGGQVIDYEETPITLKLSGDYQAIARYFHLIDDLACLVVVKKMGVAPEGGSLSANIELATYMVKKP